MFAYRYEPDWLVDEFREHMDWVDGFAELNTRADTRPFTPPDEMATTLKTTARMMGADWVLFMCPDERLEVGAEPAIRELMETRQAAYRLKLREMWTPTAYRVDGVWGHKVRRRLYRLDRHPNRGPIVDVNIYHLKMIDNREVRVRTHQTHNTWDNHGRFDYLNDERGLRLEEIPEGREFYPPYTPYTVAV